MSFFNSNLEFNKIIFRDKFYYPPQINSSIDNLSSNLKTNKESNTPFVYLFAHNHIKTVIAYFAIIKSGKICVIVDPEIKHIELGEMMQDTPPYATIKFDKNGEEFDFKNDIVFTDNNIDVDSKQLDDVCTMKYTAAEDGYAKAVMLTKKNILSNAQAILDCDRVDKNKISCALVPFHNLYTLQTGIFAPLLAGGSFLIVELTHSLQFRKIMIDISSHEVTNLYSIPMLYYLMYKDPNIKDKIKKIETFVSGGYEFSPKIYDTFLEKAGKQIRNGYGLTEASPICTWHRPEDSIKVDSIGRAFSCCKIKILNDKNEELPIAKNGEICIKGNNVMKGYFNNKKATQDVLINGWLHTGDYGKIDSDGYIYFTGLKKNMLNVAGQKVYPTEVERFILKNENVLSIQIFGEKDILLGHVIKAKIKLRINSNKSQGALKKWCRNNLSSYKNPRYIEFH